MTGHGLLLEEVLGYTLNLEVGFSSNKLSTATHAHGLSLYVSA